MANEINKLKGIIHHRGQVNTAEHEGVPIARSEKLFVDFNSDSDGAAQPAMVPCAPYDEHFIYEVPKAKRITGTTDFLCTCGSPAVVNNWYAKDRLFVCLLHADTGFHQTSLINEDERKGGLELGPIQTSRGRNWLV